MKILNRSMITAVLIGGVLAASASPAAAIVGGQEATRTHPGMAALSVLYPGLGVAQCSASLVTPRYLLTAAHCVSDMTVAPAVVPVPADRITVRVGSNNRTIGGQQATGRRVLLHPDWAWLEPTGRPVSDLALVELDRPLRSSLMPLGSDHGGPVRLLGWGLTEYPVPAGTPLPDMLRQRDVISLPASACTGGLISAGELCVSDGACFGDSGGPALRQPAGRGTGRDRRWVSVGIASRETNADTPCGAPTVYTSIGHFRRWITTTIITGRAEPSTQALLHTADAAGANRFNFLIPQLAK